MKYYLLEPDKSLADVPKLSNWYQKVDEKNLYSDRYHFINDVTVLFAKLPANEDSTELIVEPFLLLPQKAADVLSKFEPNMRYKDMPLVDREKAKMEKYMFPLLKVHDCINYKKTVFNQDKSAIIDGYLNESSIPDKVLFLPDGVNGRKVVIRQDLAECLLKRYIFGFVLRELSVIKGDV